MVHRCPLCDSSDIRVVVSGVHWLAECLERDCGWWTHIPDKEFE